MLAQLVLSQTLPAASSLTHLLVLLPKAEALSKDLPHGGLLKAVLDKDIHGEMDRISQALARRVKELAERYETPLPKLAASVANLNAKVEAHLQKNGFLLKKLAII